MELCKMEFNRVGIIEKIMINDDMKRRFMDIGIVSGSEIIRVMEDYGKGISAYIIMDSLIGIRNKDARGIIVNYE